MIVRRARYASMTIVGDLGQATHPLAAPSWRDLLTRLDRRDARTLELRTGYRVPQAIADYAARYLAPDRAATHSYRTGGSLVVWPVDDLDAAIYVVLTRALASLVVVHRRPLPTRSAETGALGERSTGWP